MDVMTSPPQPGLEQINGFRGFKHDEQGRASRDWLQCCRRDRLDW
jgi:hypothetical protein